MTDQAAPVTAGSQAAGSFPGDEPPEVLIGYYREMVLIRKFELTADQMYKRAKIGGYCHLNLGEEATVVGLMAALQEKDYLFTNYRDHGYALSRGMDPGRVMAELFGKSTGVAKGRGGSMHLFDTKTRMLGGYGIVGGQLPPATGAALALTLHGKPGPDAEAVMCQMGDGTTNIGAFHESLNLAAIWNLPIVYVIVNNRLGMGTTVEAASGEPLLYKRGASYRMPGERVDGNDVVAVREAAQAALDRARVDRQPGLLEVMSFRLRGHSVVDPARYRSAADVEEAQAADPVPAFRAQLLSAGVFTEEQAVQIEDDATEKVASAVAFADSSPAPTPDELFDFAYATPVANAPQALPGQPAAAREPRL
ncbi:pyruvate dehydrogenase (acetyl-transferring) E1 component subunit alpha [Arthrobacter sp. VKM Ac-2550]|uniref:pyruvate dehydrogenase (acetyl-transferring) E1 component subunit alpha n=1 Tax=Crystallibacter permensis TaxID=1938888 RepID=UPI002226F318|nr:pyruvate dehydrogenase (acetyl-transferring) E1 component subunit alpha [Arthrobacter sp. VKM Ac-2550]MCW2134709.1 pyruvate dehydrogenase E1 component alpha subunit [Arthrobacter sp. VKM Ac-2550]